MVTAAKAGEDHLAATVGQWFHYYGTYEQTAWHPYLVARRSIALLRHIEDLFVRMDNPGRAAVLDHLARSARHLARRTGYARGRRRNVTIASARTLLSLCLPPERLIGQPGETGLAEALKPLTEGTLPFGWRSHTSLLDTGYTLLTVKESFRGRRLSPPGALDDSLKTIRLLAGALLETTGGLRLPGQSAPSPSLLSALSPSDHSAADRLLTDLGMGRVTAGTVKVLLDGGNHEDEETAIPGALSISADGQPLIVNCGAPSPIAAAFARRLRPWREALLAQAAGSTLSDLPIEGTPSLIRPDPLTLLFDHKGRTARHARRIVLSPDGHDISGDDAIEAPASGTLRFHLAPEARVDREEDSLLIRIGRERWRFSGPSTIEIEESVSAWIDGTIVDSKQIVVPLFPGHPVQWTLGRDR
ncbi:bifunctional phosphoribosylaminoimidazolecarboxamide formyltransferase/IMP cyclohydrolase [Parvularcula bermudensis HTCC2503]|uniref:Bifunctional phosphoribosylaminoimidazolecarboxamide formyltransferase/IMP cyclohydrolase n=1 Tax=Parvularcula bermudensis (strain ATCC BAA-594 / HTCC2503 / KCTC 12087) TaxID=314260 RepID=E0TD00_PARBH|nr:bifunctional phosphoribosylaminoimidazolecarboxamide formyltransferase/IMP cyclohydrolase [Parvularcula bermudensis HTCC2503]